MIKLSRARCDISGFNSLLSRLARGSFDIEVGYFQDDSPLYKDIDGNSSDRTIAQIAAENEFGKPQYFMGDNGKVVDASIPARPFMQKSFKENLTGLKSQINSYAGGLIHDINPNVENIALWFMDKVKDTIKIGDFVPNTKYTISKKGSSSPLIDTGQMLEGIRWRKSV